MSNGNNGMNERRLWTGWIALLAMVLLVGIGLALGRGRERGEEGRGRGGGRGEERANIEHPTSNIERSTITSAVEGEKKAAAAPPPEKKAREKAREKARKLPEGFVLPAGNTLAGIVYRVGEPDEIDSTEFDEPGPPIVTKWITYRGAGDGAGANAGVRFVFVPRSNGEWVLARGAIDPKTTEPIEFEEAMRRLSRRGASEFPGDRAEKPDVKNIRVMCGTRWSDDKYLFTITNFNRESVWGLRVACWCNKHPKPVREFTVPRLKPGETIEVAVDQAPTRFLAAYPQAKVIFAPFTTSAAGSVAVPERRYAPALYTPNDGRQCVGAPDCQACTRCVACEFCIERGGYCGKFRGVLY